MVLLILIISVSNIITNNGNILSLINLIDIDETISVNNFIININNIMRY